MKPKQRELTLKHGIKTTLYIDFHLFLLNLGLHNNIKQSDNIFVSIVRYEGEQDLVVDLAWFCRYVSPVEESFSC